MMVGHYCRDYTALWLFGDYHCLILIINHHQPISIKICAIGFSSTAQFVLFWGISSRVDAAPADEL
jgi:hypothetical protein